MVLKARLMNGRVDPFIGYLAVKVETAEGSAMKLRTPLAPPPRRPITGLRRVEMTGNFDGEREEPSSERPNILRMFSRSLLWTVWRISSDNVWRLLRTVYWWK